MAGKCFIRFLCYFSGLDPLAPQSLTYKRPPLFSVFHIDTQMPQESTMDENGEEQISCETELCPYKLIQFLLTSAL